MLRKSAVLQIAQGGSLLVASTMDANWNGNSVIKIQYDKKITKLRRVEVLSRFYHQGRQL